MYSNNTAGTLDTVIHQYGTEDELRGNKLVKSGGYNVNQRAVDMTYDDDNIAEQLPELCLGGYQEHQVFVPLTYLQSANFVTFPESYARLAFIYACDDCNTCGLPLVNAIFSKVVNGSEVWGSCYYWGLSPNNQCSNNQELKTYKGKCVLYPTQILPPPFAVKRFFESFWNLTDIISLLPTKDGREDLVNYTSWQPNFLYLNIRDISKTSIKYQFVTVKKETSLWASILSLFPNLTSCDTVPNESICTGGSVCNYFTQSNSVGNKCRDMDDQNKCKDLVRRTNMSSDNVEQQRDIICRDSICEPRVPLYSVVRNMPTEMETDPLNHFLHSRVLEAEWRARAGVCTTTYTNVYRYNRTEEGNHETWFLEAKCTTGSQNQTTLCSLTGNYHKLTDLPHDDWEQLPPDMYRNSTDPLFTCYRIEDQNFGVWFITTFGVLFGWIGTLTLIFSSVVFRVFLRLRPYVVGRAVDCRDAHFRRSF